MKKGRVRTVFRMVLLMAALQAGRAAVRHILLLLFGQEALAEWIISCLLMLLLAAAVVLLARKQKVPLSVLPVKWSAGYTAATLAAAGLLLSSAWMQGPSFVAAAGILNSSVCTPFAEELIFRGYMWNRLKEQFDKDITVAIITVLLFALWHLGYADVISGKVNGENLAFIMMMKAAVGLCYGAVLGVARMKIKNAYASMLLHGVMNIFGR